MLLEKSRSTGPRRGKGGLPKRAGAGASLSAREPAYTQRKTRRRSALVTPPSPRGGASAGVHAIEQTAAPRRSPRAMSRQGGFVPRSGPGRCGVLSASPKRVADLSLSLDQHNSSTRQSRQPKLLACARLAPYGPHRRCRTLSPSAELSAKPLRPSVPRELHRASMRS